MQNGIKTPDLVLFWYRRDLRLQDNAGLYHALKESVSLGSKVQPMFIFDKNILDRLDNPSDLRVQFIHQTLQELKKSLQELGSDLWVFYGTPLEVFQQLLLKHAVKKIYTNHDYEPYARQRDQQVSELCLGHGCEFLSFKDQTLFEKSEITKDDKTPYTIYTPYKKKVLANINKFYLKSYPVDLYLHSLNKTAATLFPSLESMNFRTLNFSFPPIVVQHSLLKNYAAQRDFPGLTAGTSRLGLHLRFGTVSIRELAREGQKYSDVWLSELIWRDFFMQILWHFPHVQTKSFRPDYDKIAWRNSPEDFRRWSQGETGYPIVDAGMRELNETGHMHNRVRMIVASFLCKHLLIHWLEGERYFAKKLLDYDLAANNGNWQWAAGTGCDAAPYFRVFNPTAQTEKFDPDHVYIKKWVPEYQTSQYPAPMIEHTAGRDRALKAFSAVLKKK